MKIEITTKTPSERTALLASLLALGYKWHNEDSWTVKTIDTKFPFTNYSSLRVVDREIMGIKRVNVDALAWPKDAEEILKSLSSEIVVDNVGDYTAFISKDGIRVGCQTISLKKFQEIAEAVKTITNQ